MVAKKQAAPASSPGSGTDTGRKPWKKKTPVEVMIAQRDKLEEDIKAKEAELKELKDQLAKFEEVIKVFQK
jgi:hypothetical protein